MGCCSALTRLLVSLVDLSGAACCRSSCAMMERLPPARLGTAGPGACPGMGHRDSPLQEKLLFASSQGKSFPPPPVMGRAGGSGNSGDRVHALAVFNTDFFRQGFLLIGEKQHHSWSFSACLQPLPPFPAPKLSCWASCLATHPETQ